MMIPVTVRYASDSPYQKLYRLIKNILFLKTFFGNNFRKLTF